MGLVGAAIAGAAAISLVRHVVARGQLRLFACYLVPVAALVLIASLLGWW